MEMENKKPRFAKVGVAWKKQFRGVEALKISINKVLYFAYSNKKKVKQTDPDFIITEYVVTPKLVEEVKNR